MKMITKGLIKSKKRILLYSLSIFILVSGIYLSIAVGLQINTNQLKKNEIIKNEERLLNVEQDILSYRIERVVSDVLYISDNLSANNLDNDDFKNVENEWKSFADRKKIYDQIRYIDVEGNEKIRINYSESGSVVVGSEQLQNKKDRYYFKDTIELKKNQTYISKLDLNIENDKIEQPIKPMIRFSTPVFGQGGKLKGIVILNYYAKNILQQFEDVSITSYGNMFLLNSNGYWIYNAEDKNKEWAFMYEDKKDVNFKKEFSKEWNVLNDNNIKGTFNTENGYYSYLNIISAVDKLPNSNKDGNDSIVLGEGNWVAVSFIPNNRENQLMIFTDIYTNTIYILKNHIFIFIFIFIASLSFSIMMIIDKLEKERIKYLSEYDTMTGALNRRAGFELLNKIYQDFMKNKGNISICFCDINGLKEVNDNLGHEAGDEIILSVVNVIKNNIKDKDYIVRLGGDEFLIIFVDSDIEQSENVWNTINNEFVRINEVENRKYIISASHGIEEFKFNANEYIDQIINLADEKMYNEKRILKRDFKVLREK